jgi:hypothetical protein
MLIRKREKELQHSYYLLASTRGHAVRIYCERPASPLGKRPPQQGQQTWNRSQNTSPVRGGHEHVSENCIRLSRGQENSLSISKRINKFLSSICETKQWRCRSTRYFMVQFQIRKFMKVEYRTRKSDEKFLNFWSS